MGLRGRRLTGLISLVSGIVFFLFGYDQADFGSLLTMPDFRSAFTQLDTVNDPSRRTALIQGIANASWNLGCIVSAVATIWLGGVLGRKKTLLLGMSFLIVGEVIQVASYSLGQLIAGRVIAGIGNGFNTAAIPSYQAETTRPHRRGTHLMISGACIAAGAAFAYWIDFAFAYVGPSEASWRVPIAFQLIFALPALLMAISLPESPRWLILTGRADEALKVLGALHDVDAEDSYIYKEFLAIKDSMIAISSGGFSDIFTQGATRHFHRTLLACLIQGFQQISGINLITQYVAYILFTQFGYQGWTARLLAALIGTEGFLASCIPVYGIDYLWGRRSLLLFGAAGMSASMVILTAMAWLKGTAGQVVATVLIFVYISFFTIGWQGMSWLYSVEVVPLKVRGPATAMSTGINWLMNFWVVLVAPVAFHDIAWRTYIIFAVLNFFIFPAVYFFFPECAYRSLEEMDVIFHAASLSKSPYTTVVRDSREAPLWYGRDGSNDFDYESSEWHRQKVRFSDEVSSDTATSQGKESGDREKDAKRIESDDDDMSALPEVRVSQEEEKEREKERERQRESWRSGEEDLHAAELRHLGREVESVNDMSSGHPHVKPLGRQTRSSGRA
ncbi:MAG: hypothetical protein Q9159_005837 [Coniocarpon cinnabarinum]